MDEAEGVSNGIVEGVAVDEEEGAGLEWMMSRRSTRETSWMRQ